MSKLISTYASSVGLRIDEPNVKEHFYPHPFERYITIQTGSGQPAKNYDYFAESIALLKPILDANKIAILHLGGKDDPPLLGVHDLRGKTSFLQANYLIKRALCHVGNDSWLAHCAGWNYRPLVALYGSTSVKNHGPYWSDTARTVLLESHRAGGVPTYSSQEVPKTINWIDPVDVANAVLKVMGIQHVFTNSSRFYGLLYQHTVFELIPNTFPAATFYPDAPITVRMDHLHNETALLGLLQTGRKVTIVTQAPISLDILNQFRASILFYNHEVGVEGRSELDLRYVDAVKTLIPRHVFFTRETDPKRLSDLRFHYFDHATIESIKDTTREDYMVAALQYLNRKDTPENRLAIEGELSHTRFKTNKYVLSEGRVYLSHAHLAVSKNVESLSDNTGDVIDQPLFFRDLNHFAFLYHGSS